MTPNDLLAGGYRMAKGLLHRFTDDLTPDEFRYQPVPGANSAGWGSKSRWKTASSKWSRRSTTHRLRELVSSQTI